MENRFSGHSVYREQYHIVWTTKYRRRILKPGLKSYLNKMLRGMMRTMPGCEIEELNVQDKHIPMVMIVPPKYAVSDVVALIRVGPRVT